MARHMHDWGVLPISSYWNAQETQASPTQRATCPAAKCPAAPSELGLDHVVRWVLAVQTAMLRCRSGAQGSIAYTSSCWAAQDRYPSPKSRATCPAASCPAVPQVGA